ncbi:MAG: pyridoxamine 5'-phosphate oxidase family protein [Myxococcaceae bacterium]|nr:pyridoxamine 5'-phosphate oxidase family protein [Myxococcaceae bacterium]MCI0673273.1 pyridoxamine 5'-phosphate oxidase family protein [Myxococcaceae bacterium]
MAYTTHGRGEPGDRRELEELLSGYSTAMLTTRDEEGRLHSRPMALQQEHGPGDELWFATRVDTSKVHELEVDGRCGLSFHAGARDSSYISMSGRGELVRDRELIHRMWSSSWRPWFPQGPDAPDLALIRFIPEHVEYVHPKGGRLKVLAERVRGMVSEKQPEPAPKRELELRH